MLDGDRVSVLTLGAYAARSCPVKTQWDIVRPVEPTPAPAFLASLGAAGVGFEASVFEQFTRLHVQVEVIADDVRAAERAERTSAAMRDGVPLILGGRLPVDNAGGRVAQPDMLVRSGQAPVDGRWRYLPSDVKHHASLIEADRGAEVVVQYLDEVGPPQGEAPVTVGRRDSTTKKDLLQLAHYQRTLEACGHATPGPAWAGVLGRDEVVVWYRLDVPMWSHRSSQGGVLADATSLEVYDHEFAYRQAIAAATAEHVHDPGRPLPVQPVQITDCPNCRWREHCNQLLTDRQDASLLPAVDRSFWQQLEAVGLSTIPALAGLDPAVVDDGIDQGKLLRAVDEARALLGSDPVYRRRHVPQLQVTRADVEVDVDMENVEGGAYLWGVWVTDRSGMNIASDGYRAFVDWDPDPAQAGAAAFGQFWAWLRQLRADCREAGVTFAAYCWSASAENGGLRTGGRELDIVEEVEDFIASPEWIDLLAVFRNQLVTGHGNGLKTAATLLGFAWRDDDPGGAQSMQWWQDAVDPTLSAEERDDQRRRLLQYNEDDVAATEHVRCWLSEHDPSSIAEWR